LARRTPRRHTSAKGHVRGDWYRRRVAISANIARELARAGVNVAVNDRTAKQVKSVPGKIMRRIGYPVFRFLSCALGAGELFDTVAVTVWTRCSQTWSARLRPVSSCAVAG
jgi:hypothetical protein